MIAEVPGSKATDLFTEMSWTPSPEKTSGDLLLSQSRWAEAIDYYTSAIRRTPDQGILVNSSLCSMFFMLCPGIRMYQYRYRDSLYMNQHPY